MKDRSYMEVLDMLRAYVDACGSQHQAAKRLNVSVAHLNGILKHPTENKIGPSLLRALKLEEVVNARRYRATA